MAVLDEAFWCTFRGPVIAVTSAQLGRTPRNPDNEAHWQLEGPQLELIVTVLITGKVFGLIMGHILSPTDVNSYLYTDHLNSVRFLQDMLTASTGRRGKDIETEGATLGG